MKAYQWYEYRKKVAGLFMVLPMVLSISACNSSSNSDNSQKADNSQTADTTAPQLAAHANVTVEATSAAGANVNYNACTATDNVDSSPVISYNQNTGSTFSMGTTTVTCTATDAANNTASITFDVMVVDTTAPAVTAPADVTVAATTTSGSVVNYTACSATDAVDTAPTMGYSKTSGATFPVGTTTVTCTATDASTNAGNATFNITVNPYTPVDTSFGTPNGYIINDAAAGASGNEMAYGMAIDASGNIITVGNGARPSPTGAIWRYQSDGVLDTTFSSDGIALASDVGSTVYQWMRDVAIDTNNKPVVAGIVQVSTNTYPALWRYNADGSFDTSFGTSGFVYSTMSATNYQQIVVKNMTIDATGRILLVGNAYNTVNSRSELLVWRYTSSGVLDTTFCSTGYCVFTSDISDGEATGFDIITDGTANGKILLTGAIAYSANAVVWYYTDAVVLRLNDNGSLDSSFGNSGIASFNGPDNSIDQGTALKLDSTGKVVVTGFTRSTSTADDILVLRFNTDGSLDTSFNANGSVIISNPYRDRANDLTIAGNGQILLLGKKNRGSGTGGNGTDSNNSDVAVWRLNSDGSLDTAFGTNGVFLLKVATGNPVNYSESISQWGGILQDANGKTVIGGASHNGTNLDMTIWRLN